MIEFGQVLLFADDFNWGHMGGGWWVMGIGIVLFWALVVLGIIWVVREMSGRSGSTAGPPAPPEPLEVLDRRLAEGEIEVEEYEQRRRALRPPS